jgi:hypothetical protein
MSLVVESTGVEVVGHAEVPFEDSIHSSPIDDAAARIVSLTFRPAASSVQ